ncbi:MAG TPA: ribosome biogenesis GTP-binding protein YihA/YsxC [Burkholderiales bacterium]|nr:ribosome biogenesis GTP-binding protein YihA/YsxC [Burkholderiales bacterium]
MSLFRNASFVASAHHLYELPPPTAPEIVFAGRSNAGKSSAINTLADHKRLAFVSKTPGRTQLINFFQIANGFLVDLPGYGYAKVPEQVRKHWENTLAQYLQTRETLRGMALIMDVRHPLTPLDWNMMEWFMPSGRPIHILLTKADKLSRQEGTDALRKVRQEIEKRSPLFSAQLFSSSKKVGVEEAEKVFSAWLGLTDPRPADGGTNKKAPD